MHPKLSKFKTPNCAREIENLERCHAENPFLKFFNVCTDYHLAVARCMREEKRRKIEEARPTASRNKALAEKLLRESIRKDPGLEERDLAKSYSKTQKENSSPPTP
mmetsp:Transcript_11927/g.33603  ORF Transcript_11927/g.33603 Transcript_11927/m.33603 type:complete len:106 (+) Transcript_11927:311-628(+)